MNNDSVKNIYLQIYQYTVGKAVFVFNEEVEKQSSHLIC